MADSELPRPDPAPPIADADSRPLLARLHEISGQIGVSALDALLLAAEAGRNGAALDSAEHLAALAARAGNAARELDEHIRLGREAR